MMVYSIHVGCNDVDESQYPPLEGGWHLPCSVKSAKKMEQLVKSLHPEAQTTLLVRRPTVERVTQALKSAGARATGDDLVIFTYAGHGAQIHTSFPALAHAPPGAIAPRVGDDRNFEVTILLWDRMMIANELGAILTGFARDVRFLNVIDGCGEGSFYIQDLVAQFGEVEDRETGAQPHQARSRKLVRMGVEPDLFAQLYAKHPALYAELAKDPGPLPVRGINFGACADGETAWQDDDGSYFSRAVLESMGEGDGPADYGTLRARVEEKLLVLTRATKNPAMHPPCFPFGTGTQRDLESRPFE